MGAQGKRKAAEVRSDTYTHENASRLNNPEAGMIDYAPQVREQKTTHCWDPRETPQLVWAGKAGLKKVEVDEQTSLEIPLVNLHIHERVSTEAILRSVRREDAQRSLFADPELEFKDEVKFYQHEVGWSNRMILGDSLLVMNSLVEREAMRGKVQCIYMDPPYGIKFGSNFQPRIDQRDVKDGKDEDLTREVMQVQAFRDTWELGVHSYLTYLRDRLLVCRELLSESGSIFVQIGDENVHRVRCLMDEVFGEGNFRSQIAFTKTSGIGAETRLDGTFDYLLWYSRSEKYLYYRVFEPYPDSERAGYRFVEHANGTVHTKAELRDLGVAIEDDDRVFASGDLTKPGPGQKYAVDFQGKSVDSGVRWWGFEKSSVERIIRAGRALLSKSNDGSRDVLRFKRYLEREGRPLTNLWGGLGSGESPGYAVYTNEEVLSRCLLMTSRPGDLVLDPTCGSGTTANVAERWGRRWITCDTSRVALAIARHRLMTASYDYYQLRFPTSGVSGGFQYKPAHQVTAEVVGQCTEIDSISEDFEPRIREALRMLNSKHSQAWQEWEVPPRPLGNTLQEEAGPAERTGEAVAELYDSPEFSRFWELVRQRQERFDSAVKKSTTPTYLLDQPEKERNIVRVSGPFTMEAVPNVAEISVNVEERIFEDKQLEFFEPIQPSIAAVNVNAYIGDMIERLRKSGVNVRGKESFTIENLRPVASEHIHAEGDIVIRNGEEKRLSCAVVIGPPNGAISEIHVRDAVTISRQWDAVLFCGYEFSDAAQEMIREHVPPGKKFYMSYINADTAMGDLLKDSKASQIFTMVGEPDVRVYRFGEGSVGAMEAGSIEGEEANTPTLQHSNSLSERLSSLREGEMFIELRGVDLYDPLTGEVSSDSGRNVHAIFIDHDYDGKSFCICQALFPNKKDSWDKIARNLRGAVDEEAFEAFRTTVSLPFRPGPNGKVQVKVIDARGNAIVKTVRV